MSIQKYKKNFDDNKPDHIYYNLKIANIADGTTSASRLFSIKDDTSELLDKQSDYKLTIQSFRISLALPLFLFPIAEGFISNFPTPQLATAITNANPAVITTASAHGFVINDFVRIKNATGMTQINGDYQIKSVPTPTTFSIDLDTTDYGVYIANSAEVQGINDDINRTAFGICLTHAGTDYFYPIDFIPDKNTTVSPQLIPKSPRHNNGVQDNTTFYYYSYSFDVFCKAINKALADATTDINTAVPATLDYPPIFTYDNGKFTLIWDYKMITNSVNMYCNTILLQFLQGFRTVFQEDDNSHFKCFQFIIENDWNYQYSYAPKGLTIPSWTNKTTRVLPEFLAFEQEWDATYKFDQIVSVLIVSDYIKIRQEYYPKIGNPNSTQITGRSNNNFNTGTLNIVASFDLLDIGGDIGWQETLYYEPSVYKWIDLVSDDPLQKVDTKIYFETSKGTLLNAYIPINSQSNIRFLFERVR